MLVLAPGDSGLNPGVVRGFPPYISDARGRLMKNEYLFVRVATSGGIPQSGIELF